MNSVSRFLEFRSTRWIISTGILAMAWRMLIFKGGRVLVCHWSDCLGKSKQSDPPWGPGRPQKTTSQGNEVNTQGFTGFSELRAAQASLTHLSLIKGTTGLRRNSCQSCVSEAAARASPTHLNHGSEGEVQRLGLDIPSEGVLKCWVSFRYKYRVNNIEKLNSDPMQLLNSTFILV
jgi:hypothetical protein